MRLISMIVMLLFVSGCGQNGDQVPDKEVSGEVDNGSVTLTVEPVQKQGEIEFRMSVVNHTDDAAEFEFSSGQKFELIVSDKEGNERLPLLERKNVYTGFPDDDAQSERVLRFY